MKLARKLEAWQRAGLIDAATASAILAYEQRRRPARPYLLYAIGGLGALSVAIGLLSIVAANWQEIPAGVKLGLDLLFLCGLAAGVHVADGRARAGGDEAGASWAREVLLFLYYGATLASIGLVSQVYHLGGEERHALLYWSAITLPLLPFARGHLLSAAWLIALESTFLMNVLEWLDDVTSGLPETVLAGTTVFLTVLGLIGLGGLSWLRRVRPQLGAVAFGLGAVQWFFLASWGQHLWYIRERHAGEHLGTTLLCCAAVLGASALLAWRVPRTLDAAARRGLQVLLIYGAAGAYLPMLVEHGKVPLLGALGFLVLLGLCGFVALRLRRFALFNLATGLFALRLIIIYFEVFGSLLSTGLGLVTGGGLTLLVAWIWLRKTRQLRRAQGEGGDAK